MQFKIPQDVQREDKLVGPLTGRQLVICTIGGSIVYGLYSTLAKEYLWITWIFPVSIVALITITFAFITPQGLKFERFILFYLEYAILPKKRVWLKSTGESSRYIYIGSSLLKSESTKTSQASEDILAEKQRQIKELEKLISNKNNSSSK